MYEKTLICHTCSSPQGYQKIGFRDSCSSCGASLHCCLNCANYSPGAYNDCLEPNADRVVDKSAANFCEYFKPKFSNQANLVKSENTHKQDIMKQLDSLFKK